MHVVAGIEEARLLVGGGMVFVQELAVGVAFGHAAFFGGELEGFFAIEFGLVHEFVDAGGEGLRGVDVEAGSTFFGWTDDEGDFAFDGTFVEGLENVGELAAAKFFVEFGDFASEAGGTIPEDSDGVGDGVVNAMRGFVEDQGAIFDAQALESTLTFTTARGKKT